MIENCLICNGPVDGPVFKDLMHCSDCSFLMKQNPSDRNKLKEHLKNFLLSAAIKPAVEQRRLGKANNMLNELEKHSKIGKIYDLGAASGFVLKAARDRGWEIDGNEISVAAVNDAKSKYNIDLRYGFFDEFKYEDDSYDTVHMWNALEHTLNPKNVIDITHKMLKKGGFAYIRVPHKTINIVKGWYEADHMVEFTEKSLDKLMTTSGFEKIFLVRHPEDGGKTMDGLYIKK